MVRNALKVTAAMALCGTLAAPATAQTQDRVSSVEKGSLIIFSKVELRWNAAGTLIQDTFLQLTNDYPGAVRVQMYFVNGDMEMYSPANTPPPYGVVVEPGCNWVDNEITLTADQPTYWSAFDGQPANGGLSPFTVLDPGTPPGRPDPDGSTDRVLRGFIYAWAVNAAGEEISWNHLNGLCTIVNYSRGTAWEYNAWAIQNRAAHGQQSGTPGLLNLDGVEYAPVFSDLLLNFQAVGSTAFSGPTRLVTSNTDLTLHPVSHDFRQEHEEPITTKATFSIWNMNEVKFSGTDRCITCWDQTLLSNYGLPNHFLLANLQTDHGKARIDGVESEVVCDYTIYAENGDIVLVDVDSQRAALLGVAFKVLSFDGLLFADAGSNLSGMGVESAYVRYDLVGPPPTATAPTTKVFNAIESEVKKAVQSRGR